MCTNLRVPKYRLHKQSGQAIVTLPDGFGGRRDVLLGAFGSKESKAEYRRVIVEWESRDRRMIVAGHDELTVAELLTAARSKTHAMRVWPYNSV